MTSEKDNESKLSVPGAVLFILALFGVGFVCGYVIMYSCIWFLSGVDDQPPVALIAHPASYYYFWGGVIGGLMLAVPYILGSVFVIKDKLKDRSSKTSVKQYSIQQPQSSTANQQPQYRCKDCETILIWVPQYKRWYCKICQEYK